MRIKLKIKNVFVEVRIPLVLLTLPQYHGHWFALLVLAAHLLLKHPGL